MEVASSLLARSVSLLEKQTGESVNFAMTRLTQIPFDFSALIFPVTLEDFFSEHWERRHLHVQNRPNAHYDRLLTVEDIDNFISRADARYPAVRLAKGGTFYPKATFTRDVRYGDEFFEGIPDVEKIFT